MLSRWVSSHLVLNCRPTTISLPSTYQPIIRVDAESGDRTLVQMRWGLIPARVGDPDSFKIYTTSNARGETVLEKSIWKVPFQQSRCLIPVDGFYEWLQGPSLPQPPPLNQANTDCLATQRHQKRHLDLRLGPDPSINSICLMVNHMLSPVSSPIGGRAKVVLTHRWIHFPSSPRKRMS
jgi:hypothetical protein